MYNKALKINEEFGRKEGMADNYHNLGVLYNKRGETARAEEMFRKEAELRAAMKGK